MKIYTKTGDQGFTSLFGGSRISKDDIRIEAYGTVDELNSFVGALSDIVGQTEEKLVLYEIQNRLFDIGSALASEPGKGIHISGIDDDDITMLEIAIDHMEASLSQLRNFILPSGHASVSAAHICRTVCRRAERRIISLSKASEINPLLIQYLNRLSDYFFVLARQLGKLHGVEDVIWKKKL